MASTTAAEAAVPEDDDDDLEQASPPEGGSATGRDPWQGSRLGGTGPPSPDAQAEYREFLQHLQRRTRPGRRHRADESDEGGEPDDRSNAGPPPTWDGTTSFRDYLVRARLWLATTKVKPRARGPLLLKSLSSTPFDDLKHLARDDSWMEDPQNGQLLLKMMDTKELYGEDEREEMLQSLVTVTYTLRRSKGESHKAFFSRWENAIRKLHEHSIELPKEYLGFLLTMALQLSSEEVKLLMNYTQGRLGPKDVKDWPQDPRDRSGSQEQGERKQEEARRRPLLRGRRGGPQRQRRGEPRRRHRPGGSSERRAGPGRRHRHRDDRRRGWRV